MPIIEIGRLFAKRSGLASAGEPPFLLATEARDIFAATGNVVIGAELNAFEASDVFAGSQPGELFGIMSAIENSDVAEFLASPHNNGNMSASEQADILAFSATVLVQAAMSASEPADTASVSASLIVSGDLTATEAVDVLAAEQAAAPTAIAPHSTTLISIADMTNADDQSSIAITIPSLGAYGGMLVSIEVPVTLDNASAIDVGSGTVWGSTRVASAGTGGGNRHVTESWLILNPTAGSTTLTITWATQRIHGEIQLSYVTGLLQASPVGNIAGASSGDSFLSTYGSSTFTTANDDSLAFLIAALRDNTGTTTCTPQGSLVETDDTQYVGSPTNGVGFSGYLECGAAGSHDVRMTRSPSHSGCWNIIELNSAI